MNSCKCHADCISPERDEADRCLEPNRAEMQVPGISFRAITNCNSHFVWLCAPQSDLAVRILLNGVMLERVGFVGTFGLLGARDVADGGTGAKPIFLTRFRVLGPAVLRQS